MAVFTPRPMQTPNLTTNYAAENAAFANLGQSLGNLIPDLKKQQLDAQKQQLLGSLASGNPDYAKVGMGLVALGDTQGGAALIGLGQKAKERESEDAWRKGGVASPYLGGSPSTPSVPTAPVPTGPAISGGRAAPRPFDRPVQVAENEDDVARLEAEMESRTQIGYGNPALPAGMRNNNPGNIKFVGLGQAPGVIGPSQNTDQGDPQAVFNSPEAGMAAAHELALRKYQSGKRTANDLIAGQNGWTPGNTAAAANVARSMGLSPDEDLQLTNPQRAQAFLRALTAQEHGRAGASYPPEMIQSAVNGAGQQPAQVAQAPNLPGGGTYAQSTAEELQNFLNSPRVPENMKVMMREELTRRQGSQQPVQVAQAPAQPGAAVSDAPNQPSPDAANAEFIIPGTTPQQSQSILNDPQVRWARERFMSAPEKYRAQAQADLNLAVEDAKQRNKGDEPTGDIKEYNLYRRQTAGRGQTPEDFTTWQRANKAAGASSVKVGLEGETAESKKIGESAGTRAGETMAAASSASKQLMRLGQIEAIMKNVETGRLQPNRMSIAAIGKSMGVDDKFLEGIGLDPKGVGDAQALNAISGRMLVDMIGSGGFPANNFSNTDREFLTGTLPSLANDPRANSLLLEVAKRSAQIDIEKAKGWREWKRGNPKGSFDDYELEFGDKLASSDRFADLAQKAEALTGRQRVVTPPPPAARPAPAAAPPPQAAPQQRAPAPASAPTAINPKTGERQMWDGNAWVPFS